MGVESSTPPQSVLMKRRPTKHDNPGFNIGCFWLVEGTEEIWVLVAKFNPITNVQEANWTLTSSGDLIFRTDDGNNTQPVLGVINLIGGLNIDTSGVPALGNLTVALQNDVVIPGNLTITSLAAGGAVTTNAIGLLQTSNGANGQVLIGGAGTPIWASITSGDGSITFTPGANSLDMVVTAGVGAFGGLIDESAITAIPDGAYKVTLDAGPMITTDASLAPSVVRIGIVPAPVVADPQVMYAPAAGGSPSWGTLVAAGGATIVDVGGVITITAGAGGAGGVVLVHTDGVNAAINIVDSSVTIAGGDCIVTSGAVNTVTVGLTQGTDGQVILGATGLAPAWATLASADGSITFTPGANTLDFSVTAPGGFGGLIDQAAATAAPDGAMKVTVLGGARATASVDTYTTSSIATGASELTVALDYPSGAAGDDGKVLIASSAGAPIWKRITGSASVIVTNTPNTITLTAGGGAGTGIQILDCISGVATPDPATPTLVYIEGDADPASGGYNNITTRGTVDLVEVVLQPRIYLPNTNAGGTTGVVYLHNNRFIHNYGTYNTFYGQTSGNLTLTTANAQKNTGVGYQALTALVGTIATNATCNTATGATAMAACTNGSYNSAYGANCLDSLTTGTHNTGAGNSCLTAVATSSYNTGYGSLCLDSLTGSQQTAVGYDCASATTTGVNSVAIGYQALKTNITGSYCVAVGHSALGSVNSSYNIGVGSSAQVSAGKTHNIVIGSLANSSYDETVIMGDYAKSGGDHDVVIGYEANRYSDITTGDSTIIGYQAMKASSMTNHRASKITAIGYLAGGNYDGTVISNNVCINSRGIAGESNAIHIGDLSSIAPYTSFYIGGAYGRAVGAINSLLYIDNAGKLGTTGANTPLYSFSAYQNGDIADVTGDGTVYWLGGGVPFVARFDDGVCISNLGGGVNTLTITAPVTGRWFVEVNFTGWVAPVPPPPPTSCPLNIVTTTATFQLIGSIWNILPNGEQSYFMTALCAMTAGQTITFNIDIGGTTKKIGSRTGKTWIAGFKVS